jgi:hypothetical protein
MGYNRAGNRRRKRLRRHRREEKRLLTKAPADTQQGEEAQPAGGLTETVKSTAKRVTEAVGNLVSSVTQKISGQ